MTDTAAPRFTVDELLLIAKDARANGQLTPAAAIEAYAADLSNAPTRDDLSALIADHFMLGKKYADQYADIFIAAGVKVRP